MWARRSGDWAFHTAQGALELSPQGCGLTNRIGVGTGPEPRPALAIPLSDVFRRHQDTLLPLVDAISFKAPSAEAFTGKRRFLEVPLSISDSSMPERLANEGYLEALESGRFCSLSCDLGPAWTSVGTVQSAAGFPRYVPGEKPLDEAAYLRQAERNVEFLRNRFNGSLRLENLNYFPTGAYELVCEPQFITRIVGYLGLELLLDLSHASISATNLGMPLQHYLEDLPLERVRELHVSASRIIDGVLEDAHDLPTTREYEVVDELVQRGTVRYMTIEYYRDDAALVAEYQRLSTLRGNTA